MGAAKGMLIIIELDCIRALDQGPGSQNKSHFKDVYTHTLTVKKGNTQHQSRHLRMILEIVSREAFRLARELFHIRLTNMQTDRQTH